MPGKNPWNNRTALVAVAFAFFAGLLGALALRDDTRPAQHVGERVSRDAVNWRVPVAFGTNLPALGDNILLVA